MIPSEVIELARQKWPEMSEVTAIREVRCFTVEYYVLKPRRELVPNDLTPYFINADMTLNPEKYTLEQHWEIAMETSPFEFKYAHLEPITDDWAGVYVPEIDKFFYGKRAEMRGYYQE